MDNTLITLKHETLKDDLFLYQRINKFILSTIVKKKWDEVLDDKLREYLDETDNIYERDFDFNSCEIKFRESLPLKNSKEELPNLNYIIRQVNMNSAVQQSLKQSLVEIKSSKQSEIDNPKSPSNSITYY